MCLALFLGVEEGEALGLPVWRSTIRARIRSIKQLAAAATAREEAAAAGTAGTAAAAPTAPPAKKKPRAVSGAAAAAAARRTARLAAAAAAEEGTPDTNTPVTPECENTTPVTEAATDTLLTPEPMITNALNTVVPTQYAMVDAPMLPPLQPHHFPDPQYQHTDQHHHGLTGHAEDSDSHSEGDADADIDALFSHTDDEDGHSPASQLQPQPQLQVQSGMQARGLRGLVVTTDVDMTAVTDHVELSPKRVAPAVAPPQPPPTMQPVPPTMQPPPPAIQPAAPTLAAAPHLVPAAAAMAVPEVPAGVLAAAGEKPAPGSAAVKPEALPAAPPGDGGAAMDVGMGVGDDADSLDVTGVGVCGMGSTVVSAGTVGVDHTPTLLDPVETGKLIASLTAAVAQAARQAQQAPQVVHQATQQVQPAKPQAQPQAAPEARAAIEHGQQPSQQAQQGTQHAQQAQQGTQRPQRQRVPSKRLTVAEELVQLLHKATPKTTTGEQATVEYKKPRGRSGRVTGAAAASVAAAAGNVAKPAAPAAPVVGGGRGGGMAWPGGLTGGPGQGAVRLIGHKSRKTYGARKQQKEASEAGPADAGPSVEHTGAAAQVDLSLAGALGKEEVDCELIELARASTRLMSALESRLTGAAATAEAGAADAGVGGAPEAGEVCCAGCAALRGDMQMLSKQLDTLLHALQALSITAE